MKRLCGVGLLLALPLAAQAPVGLLSSVRGTVQIVRAGQTAPVAAKMADLIGPGDRLITGPNSEAVFLYCPDPRSARLPAGGEVVFAATALQVRRGKLADERKTAGCRLPATLALAASSQQQVGLVKTRPLGLVTQRAPVGGTFIPENRPVFRWQPVEGAKSYDIRVTDREEQTLFKTTVTGTEITYPAEAPALAAGRKYWWRVVARDGEENLSEANNSFQTMSDTQAKEFKAAEADLKKQIAATPADSGPKILLAFLYEEYGMWDLAARAYDDLSRQIGENDWLKVRLYTAMGKLGWERVDR
jgi:hypothetical protein